MWKISSLFVRFRENNFSSWFHNLFAKSVRISTFFIFSGVNFSASEDAFGFHDSSVFIHTLSMMLFGGFLAFCMEVAEFMVVTFASSLTLAIVGVVKVSKSQCGKTRNLLSL